MMNQNSNMDNTSVIEAKHLWSLLNDVRGDIDLYRTWPFTFVILFLRYIMLQAKRKDSYPIVIPKDCDFSDIVFHSISHYPTYLMETIGKIESLNPILRGAFSEFDFSSLTINIYNEGKNLWKNRLPDRFYVLSPIIIAIDEIPNEVLINRMSFDTFIDCFLNFIANDISGLKMGGIYDPSFISELMAKIAGIDKSQSNNISVYDPACGTASFLISASKTAQDKKVHIYGQDINKNMVAIAKMNLILHDCFDFDIENGDTLNSPEFLEEPHTLKTFDFILSKPPFSLMSYDIGNIENNSFGRWGSVINYIPPSPHGISAFLLHIVKSLNETGFAACIVSESFLFQNGEGIAVRRYLVEQGYIRAIISLPSNIFYGTGISTCILIFDKKNALERQNIFMIDASKDIVKSGPKNILDDNSISYIVNTFLEEKEQSLRSRKVPISEIKDNNYYLGVKPYLKPKISVPEGYELKYFYELVTILHNTTAVEGQDGYVIKIGDLEKEWINVIKHPSDYTLAKVPRGYHKYSRPVLLIARIGGPKATYIMASENNPIYVNNDIAVCSVNIHKVNVEYLVLTFFSSFDKLLTVGVIPRIAVDDLKKLKLAIAPKAMQDGIFAEAKRAYQIESLRRNGLEELLDSKKNEFIEELRIKKHNMAQDLAAMRNNVSALKKFLYTNNLDSMLISERRGISVGAHLDRLFDAMGRMAEGISLLTEDYVFGEPDKLDLIPFFKEYESGKRMSKGIVEFYYDESALRELYNDDRAVVLFNKHDLEEVVNQILANADKHGFIDTKRTDYKVNIYLGYVEEERMFDIRISDNGNPLPKGMDTKSYGIRGEKGGKNAGSGIGGYRVRVITEHFGGKVNLTSSEEWPVIVELLIPVSIDPESIEEED